MSHKLRDAVRDALHAAGERSCDRRVTRTTGRNRYIPGAPGFRLYGTADRPSFAARGGEPRWYLGVGHADHLRKVLRRYAAILTAAGFTVHVCSTHERPSVVRVYIDAPWGHDVEYAEDELPLALSGEDPDATSVLQETP